MCPKYFLGHKFLYTVHTATKVINATSCDIIATFLAHLSLITITHDIVVPRSRAVG
jgi:hypothetical protein